MSRRPASACLALAVAAPLLLGLTACGGSTSGVQASVASPATSAASASSASPTSASSSPSETATPEDTATPTGTATPGSLEVAEISGYTYEDAPPGCGSVQDTMMGTGTVEAAEARSVIDSSGELAAVLLVAQYTDSVVANLDTLPEKIVLGAAIGSAKAAMTGKVTEASVTIGGKRLSIISSKTLTVAVAYFPGGMLVQLYGPIRSAVVAVAKAYVKAAG